MFIDCNGYDSFPTQITILAQGSFRRAFDNFNAATYVSGLKFASVLTSAKRC